MEPGAVEREEVAPAGPAPTSRVAQEPRAQAHFRSELGCSRIAGRSHEMFQWLSAKTIIKMISLKALSYRWPAAQSAQTNRPQ